jgi:hypothetical protein
VTAAGHGRGPGNRGELREQFERLLASPAAHETRVAYCTLASEMLAVIGHRAWVVGSLQRDAGAQALGDVLQMAGELGEGTVLLLDADRKYAGAALVRQIVECEYLVWLFAAEPEEARNWRTGSPEAGGTSFAPGAMRKRSDGRFRAEEYASHCERGGHPREAGAFLLSGHNDSRQLAEGRWQWLDLAQHLERLWSSVPLALESHHVQDALDPPHSAALQKARERWWANDALAARLVFGEDGPELPQPAR